MSSSALLYPDHVLQPDNSSTYSLLCFVFIHPIIKTYIQVEWLYLLAFRCSIPHYTSSMHWVEKNNPVIPTTITFNASTWLTFDLVEGLGQSPCSTILYHRRQLHILEVVLCLWADFTQHETRPIISSRDISKFLKSMDVVQQEQICQNGDFLLRSIVLI